jgi:hypothetical protein
MELILLTVCLCPVDHAQSSDEEEMGENVADEEFDLYSPMAPVASHAPWSEDSDNDGEGASRDEGDPPAHKDLFRHSIFATLARFRRAVLLNAHALTRHPTPPSNVFRRRYCCCRIIRHLWTGPRDTGHGHHPGHRPRRGGKGPRRRVVVRRHRQLRPRQLRRRQPCRLADLTARRAASRRALRAGAFPACPPQPPPAE